MEVALKEALGMIIGGIDTRVIREGRGKKVGRHDTGIHIHGGQSGKGSSVIIKEPAAGRMVTKEEGGGCILTDDRAIAKIGNHTKVFDDGHPKYGIDCHIIAKAKRDADGTAIVVNVGRFVANDGS
jgi:hypothetical protein